MAARSGQPLAIGKAPAKLSGLAAAKPSGMTKPVSSHVRTAKIK